MRVDDVLSDLDLLTLDRQVFTHFGQASLATVGDKRRLAVSDWLAGELKARGYDPTAHTTRHAPEYLVGVTGAVETDYRATLADRTAGGTVDLHDVFATPSTDTLIVGHVAPFKALSAVLFDDVNVRSISIASVTYWNGHHFASLGANSFLDTTRGSAISSISFSGGGAFRFVPPDDWETLPQDALTDPWLYQLRVQMSATPSLNTFLRQLTPTRQSRLTMAAGFYALHLLSLEAAKGSRGDWDDRAAMYAQKASTALDRDLALAADEFDVDNTGAVSDVEASSVTPTGPWTFERG